jgi:hypothetical protein
MSDGREQLICWMTESRFRTIYKKLVIKLLLSVMVHACNPSTQEMGQEDLNLRPVDE